MAPRPGWKPESCRGQNTEIITGMGVLCDPQPWWDPELWGAEPPQIPAGQGMLHPKTLQGLSGAVSLIIPRDRPRGGAGAVAGSKGSPSTVKQPQSKSRASPISCMGSQDLAGPRATPAMLQGPGKGWGQSTLSVIKVMS